MAILGEEAGAFDDTEGIILLTTLSLDEALRQRLLHSLQRRPRPVLLANPDLAAPREDGFTLEPGYIAWEIMQKTACIPIGLGKPHAPIATAARRAVLRRRALRHRSRKPSRPYPARLPHLRRCHSHSHSHSPGLPPVAPWRLRRRPLR